MNRQLYGTHGQSTASLPMRLNWIRFDVLHGRSPMTRAIHASLKGSKQMLIMYARSLPTLSHPVQGLSDSRPSVLHALSELAHAPQAGFAAS